MSTQKTYKGWVRHSNGQAYYQQPADNQWGFDLLDDDQTYPGGTGIGNGTWEPISVSGLSLDELERLNYLADD